MQMRPVRHCQTRQKTAKPAVLPVRKVNSLGCQCQAGRWEGILIDVDKVSVKKYKNQLQDFKYFRAQKPYLHRHMGRI